LLHTRGKARETLIARQAEEKAKMKGAWRRAPQPERGKRQPRRRRDDERQREEQKQQREREGQREPRSRGLSR
jgi:hypothetical protein